MCTALYLSQKPDTGVANCAKNQILGLLTVCRLCMNYSNAKPCFRIMTNTGTHDTRAVDQKLLSLQGLPSSTADPDMHYEQHTGRFDSSHLY